MASKSTVMFRQSLNKVRFSLQILGETLINQSNDVDGI